MSETKRVSDERLARVIALQAECASLAAKRIAWWDTSEVKDVCADLSDARAALARKDAEIAEAEVRGATWALSKYHVLPDMPLKKAAKLLCAERRAK